MAVGTAAVFGDAAFGGILLLYNEEPDEAHTGQDSRTMHGCPGSVRLALFCLMRPAADRCKYRPSAVPHPVFFPYRRTVTAGLPKCLAVYVGVCAVQTFPA